jgi:hypothetical protein
MATDVANRWLIFDAVGGLVEMEVVHGPCAIDPDDIDVVKAAFGTYVLPRVAEWSAGKRQHLRVSLAYYLQRSLMRQVDVLVDLQDLTMREPADQNTFFLWLWEVLFPNETVDAVDTQNVVESNDIEWINMR